MWVISLNWGIIMKKFVIFLLFFSLSFINAVKVLYSPTFDASLAKEKQACFAWDLNDVLFEKKIKPTTLLKHIHQEVGILKTPKLGWKIFRLWKKKKKLQKEGKPEGSSWDGLFTLYAKNDPQAVVFFRNLVRKINVLNPQMVKLMKQLSDNGHTHGVLSNMGQNILNVQIDHLTTLPTQNHELKTFFLDFLINKKHNIISSAENSWITKPNPNMYKLFLEKNKDRGQITIFIDDKIENVQAAITHGFDVGIHYPLGSTPTQLKNLLHTELNIAH